MAATDTTKTKRAKSKAKAESPVELIRSAFEALDAHDLDAQSSNWHDDIVVNFVPIEVRRGKQNVRSYFADLFAAFPDFHIEIDRIAGEDETVFVKWRATGTFTGQPFLGVDPTGKQIEVEGIDCFTVRDGLVQENFAVYDGAGYARQIGMLPAQGSPQDRAMTAAFNGVTRLRKRLNR
jgi:steroid delta-isomerase-like uncharacterized protein